MSDTTNVSPLPAWRNMTLDTLTQLAATKPDETRRLLDHLSLADEATAYSNEAAAYYALGMIRVACLIEDDSIRVPIMACLAKDVGTLGKLGDWFGRMRRFGKCP